MTSIRRVLLPTLPDAVPLSRVTLFGFDDRAFPFQDQVQAHLSSATQPQVVLRGGPPEAHDEAVRFYGTVLRTGGGDGDFHMWYFGCHGQDRGTRGFGHGLGDSVLCYATSRDGFSWEKPDLGLVEFNGSRHNNIVDLLHPGFRSSCAVLHDAEEADPARRFKMAYEAPMPGSSHSVLCVAFSADGLRWTPSPRNPVGPFFEMAGIVRWRGLYYVTGQGNLAAHRPVPARRLCTFVSADFERWSPCSAMGFERTPNRPGPSPAADTHHEEVHLGAALWDRGNVLLGVYGQWHGHPSGDRRLLTMDLGLTLSHDALHFYEPIPDFKIVPAREQPSSPAGSHPALMQGQGFHNVGDHTLYYYAAWLAPNSPGVYAASWPRDRLGALQPFSAAAPLAVTCPIQVLAGEGEGNVPVLVNVSGLGQHGSLRIEALDEGFRPLAGVAGESAAQVAENGFAVPVQWPDGAALREAHGRFRLAVHFEGVRPEDIRLHALYIGDEALIS